MSSTGYNNSTPPLIPGDIQVSNIAINKKIQTPFEIVEQETNETTDVQTFTSSFRVITQEFTTPAQGTTSFLVINPNIVGINNVQATIVNYGGALGLNGFPVMTIKSTSNFGECSVNISNVAPVAALLGNFAINFNIMSG
jgi:hypothetical protein